jgi:hypothetical protein
MRARILLFGTMAALSAFGQSVVSVRSGLIHFSEGEVFLSDLPVEQKAGKFPEIGEGAELRTEAGRAEVLLTPGMVLRVGPDSAVRMVSASLIDTKVEFRRGSAMIEVNEDPTDTMARIVYRDYVFRFPKRGTFRIDSLPREFRVYDGEAEVSYLGDKTTVAKDHKMSLYGGLEAEVLRRSITDGLDEWSMRRNTQLTADNPPPGDLNGDSSDPAFALDPSAFYGLYSHGPSVGPYTPTYGGSPYGSLYGSPYGSIYGPGYIPGFNTYGSYGFIQPLPIYIYGPRGIYSPSRPGGGVYSPPIRMPVRPPVLSVPRPVSRPVLGHPISVGHK